VADEHVDPGRNTIVIAVYSGSMSVERAVEIVRACCGFLTA
jgi:hypothetical protein